jgi:hypothetical protein
VPRSGQIDDDAPRRCARHPGAPLLRAWHHGGVEGMSAELFTTAKALAADAAAREVVRAWRARGIDSILLKGPTTAEWLYPHAARGYADADLLVAPDRVLPAANVLEELGFAPVHQHVSDHAHPWVRGSDQAAVDLHVTVWGPSRNPQWVWAELQDWVVPFALGQETVRALSLPARALHITLHAAQHRDTPRQPEDLRRLLAQTSVAQWREAERLADRLWALLPMAIGLALEPDGERLLAELPLVRAAAAAERDGARLAVGFTRLSAAPGLRGKAAVIATAVRSAAEDVAVDQHAPHPRRTRLAAYARRVAWLIAQAPATVVSLRRHRSRARQAPDQDHQTRG